MYEKEMAKHKPKPKPQPEPKEPIMIEEPKEDFGNLELF
jgi:hypothetical protein